MIGISRPSRACRFAPRRPDCLGPRGGLEGSDCGRVDTSDRNDRGGLRLDRAGLCAKPREPGRQHHRRGVSAARTRNQARADNEGGSSRPHLRNRSLGRCICRSAKRLIARQRSSACNSPMLSFVISPMSTRPRSIWPAIAGRSSSAFRRSSSVNGRCSPPPPCARVPPPCLACANSSRPGACCPTARASRVCTGELPLFCPYRPGTKSRRSSGPSNQPSSSSLSTSRHRRPSRLALPPSHRRSRR